MNLIDYFNLKNILGIKSKAYSLRFGRNKKFYTHNKPSSNQKIYESPLTRNYLPKISKFNSLNATKKIAKFNKYMIPEIKFDNKTNLISSRLGIKEKFTFSPLKNSLLFTKIIDKQKFKYESNRNKNPLYQTVIMGNSKIKIEDKSKNDIKGKNKMKELRKIINIYEDKNEIKNKNKSNNNIENESELNEIEDKKNNNKIIRTNSMFMTEMNFMINNKRKKKIKDKINKIKEENDQMEKIGEEINNSKYNFLNFKELLKHIEKDKQRIINNQNDIDDMIKTTKDTYYEIWKCNHH